jgi:hypothetical protein
MAGAVLGKLVLQRLGMQLAMSQGFGKQGTKVNQNLDGGRAGVQELGFCTASSRSSFITALWSEGKRVLFLQMRDASKVSQCMSVHENNVGEADALIAAVAKSQ